MPRRPRPRITPDDLARLRLPGDPRLSPDGRFLVYVETSFDLRRNRAVHALHLVDVERGTDREWTRGGPSDTAPCWTPDSRAVVFASDRGGSTNLWRIGLRDRAPEQLTKLDGKASTPKVSPDGRMVAFLHAPRRRFQTAGSEPPAGPQVRHLVKLDFKQDGRGFRDGSWTHLWVLDLATRRTRQITSGEFDDGQHDWAPDSRRLAFVSNRIPRADVLMMNSDIFVVPARGGRIRQLTRFRGPKQSPAWSPDGRRIAFVGHARFPETVENLHVWVVSAGGGRSQDLMPRADLMCDDCILSDVRELSEGAAPQPVWSRDGRRIFFVVTQNGASNVWEVPAAGGAPRQRSFGHHEIAGLSQSADGRRWAFGRLTATSPGEVFVAEALAGRGPKPAPAPGQRGAEALVPGARVRQLTRVQASFASRRPLVSPEEMRIATRDGHEIHGWVLRGGRGRRPAVLAIHGGPHAAYGWSYFHEFQVLAARGYHVFYTNLRGSVGYGREFMRALVGRWGSVDYDDLMRVTDAIEALPIVDRERIVVAGGSYGGYLASWAVAHTRRFRGAIAMRGVYDLVSMHGTSDVGSDLVHEFEAQEPWESIDRWWRVSPLAHVARIRTPILLMHSEDDLRCPISQAEEMFVALRVLGRDVELVRFLGESHGLSRSGRPHNRIERLRRILDWLARKM